MGLIQNVMITPLKRFTTPAGAVLHALKASAPGFAGFAEAYFSEIHEGAIKSWRRHKRVTLNLVVPRGNVRFIICDDGAEKDRFADYCIGEENYARLTVPPGLWMAFRGEGPGTSLVLDITDGEHDPTEADNKDLSAIDFSW
jgi:dTDP-4-dehydrorhamnose 3,5-epimerase